MLIPRLLRWLALAGAVFALAGCTTLSYFWQAFNGQMEVQRLARPVEEVLADGATGAELKRKLAYAQRARDFASRELALPDNRSYRLYADLQRPYVVWNVFAAPELSLTMKTQCFPVAGCVPYRGYFAKQAADAHAAELRAGGDDVYVGGVPAYSTLGWFNDPLLSTFVRFPELEIARLIFHELAHQVAYAKDDTTFNESYAVAVEEEGLKRWVKGNATPEELARYDTFKARQRDLIAALMSARTRLEGMYAGSGDDAARRAGKAQAIAALQADYVTLKAGWKLTDEEAKRYDEWFYRDLNNARLGSVAVYTAHVAAFARLIAQDAGDMQKFHARVKALAKLPRDERKRQLATIEQEQAK
jgi:predicted aminopeptidase